MCFSATVSYSAATVLIGTGIYALHQAQRLPLRYRGWALIPICFGIQQICEGRVWDEMNAGDVNAALPYALGFHFFSHFLWLWLFPLLSYLTEPDKIRQRVIAACAILGAFSGTLVYSAILMHPDWMSIEVRGHSIVYGFSTPYRGLFHIPIPPSALYALIVLTPLLYSSHRMVKIFGGLVVLSVVLASISFAYAFVSVWCLFVALLSVYLVYMIRRMANTQHR